MRYDSISIQTKKLYSFLSKLKSEYEYKSFREEILTYELKGKIFISFNKLDKSKSFS